MTPHVVTENGFEQQFQVNHLSHFLLFQLLKDMLIASSTPSFHSRVIALSSSVHTFGSVRIGDYKLRET
jgi:NAD(P)-dependent dehydrogenase (short-subunit alcohol dehydrogenase family)